MRRLQMLLVLLAGLLAAPPLWAQTPEPTQAELRSLAELLRRPEIQSWLQAQAEAIPSPAVSTAAAGGSTREAIAARLDAVRGFLAALAAAAPSLPAELSRAAVPLEAEMKDRGPFPILLPLLVFAGLGFGAEWLFWWATTGFRNRTIATRLDSMQDRLRAIGRRCVYGLGMLLAFATGSIGAFLLLDWPPLLRDIVLTYLAVFLVVRTVLVFGRLLLAPGAERFRMIPMATPAAQFWYVWSVVLIGYFIFVRLTLDLLLILGVSATADYLIGVTFGIVLIALTLWVVWRYPDRETGRREHRNTVIRALLSLYVVTVWLLLFTGSPTPFYVGIVFLLLPIAIRCVDLAVNHLLRPPGSAASEAPVPSLTAVTLERGLRALLLIGSAYLVASILDLDLGALTSRETMATRLMRGAINAVVIFLIADFAWHLARAWIDRKLHEAGPRGHHAEGDEARRRARLRTLLPILRNVLFVVLMVMAGLMALSAMGVQIAPLIAGAGVVGVAIGFGAQTLVRDIISGMFFLLDDAFRVGEYIESGSIRGTVEAFSLRSMKLRHHRGALHTIPFGSLEKITNYSRDWVIDKMMIGVTYDTDLDKVKKIIKQIGKDLQADPEFAPHILETLKMQGVEAFGDFAIQVRMKMMTKPGEQFVIRRRAYTMMKKAFDANGINFAFPTVTVAAGATSDSTTAMAQKAFELTQPPQAAAAG